MNKKKIILACILTLLLTSVCTKAINRILKNSVHKQGSKYNIEIKDSLFIKTLNSICSFEIIGDRIFCGCPFYLLEYNRKGEYIRTYEGIIKDCPTGKEKINKKKPMRLDTWGYDEKNGEVYVWSNYEEYFFIYKDGILVRRLRPQFAKDKHMVIERGRKGIYFVDSLIFLSTLPYGKRLDSSYSTITFLDKAKGKTEFVLKNICHQPNNIRRMVNIEFDDMNDILYVNPSNEASVYSFDIKKGYKDKFGLHCVDCVYSADTQNKYSINMSLKYNPVSGLLFRTIMKSNQYKKNHRHADILQIYKHQNLIQEVSLDQRFSDIVYISSDLEVWFAGQFNPSTSGIFLYKTKLVPEN